MTYLGDKWRKIKRIGSKASGVVARVGAKTGSVLAKIGDVASHIPVLAETAPFFNAASEFATGVGGVAAGVHGALDSKSIREATGYVGNSVLAAKRIRKQVLERKR
jgi:hypothetical protein